MKSATSLCLSLTALFVLTACADDGKDNDEGAASETGDGDGDPGDGDGDPDDGDGDPGDGDGEPGDGDGEPGDGDGEPGDGDGEPGDGDGDGEPGDGDGDGEPGDGDGEPGSDNCAITHETCAELIAAFEAETLAIRSCTADSQCGQELPGTSCGCTRNWVATLDADTECFYSLIDQAGALECELGLGSTCDCPEADGFVCEGAICQWNYL